MEPSSPPQQTCCFWCSPKRMPGKKGKEDGPMGFELESRDWGKNDEILSDSSTFSVEEQQRRLKKALKEEERVSQEAEKVVNWVKQASARMDVSVVEDSLRRDEKIK